MDFKTIKCKDCGTPLGTMKERRKDSICWIEENARLFTIPGGIPSSRKYVACKKCLTEYVLYSTACSYNVITKKPMSAHQMYEKVLLTIAGYLSEYTLENKFSDNAELEARAHQIKAVTDIAMQLAENRKDINSELLMICSQHYDDGRVPQYQYIHSFDDELLSSNALGLDQFDRWCLANSVYVTQVIQVIRDVMYYHGRIDFAKGRISEFSMPYVEIITKADELASTYIEEENHVTSDKGK